MPASWRVPVRSSVEGLVVDLTVAKVLKVYLSACVLYPAPALYVPALICAPVPSN